LTAETARGVTGAAPNDTTDTSGGAGGVSSDPGTGGSAAGGQGTVSNTMADPGGDGGCGCRVGAARSKHVPAVLLVGLLVGAIRCLRRHKR